MLRAFLLLAISFATWNTSRAQDAHDEIYLRAMVEAIVPLADFSGSVMLADRDPGFALTLRVESAVPAVANFPKGAVVTLAIHSPSQLFAGEHAKGKTYNFSLSRDVENGKVTFSSLTAEAHQPCKQNPRLVGQCFRFHGRAFTSNGTPDLRIWRIRTNRILGVTASATADDAEDPIAPDNLLSALGAAEHFVFGDFEVCPFTPEREGYMQMVCVERADNLVVKPYGYGTKE